MNKAEMAKMEKQWQAEHDLRTLIDAEKIKRDKGRYAAAMKAHKEQKAALESIAKDKKD
jgi:hypothetical protein